MTKHMPRSSSDFAREIEAVKEAALRVKKAQQKERRKHDKAMSEIVLASMRVAQDELIGALGCEHFKMWRCTLYGRACQLLGLEYRAEVPKLHNWPTFFVQTWNEAYGATYKVRYKSTRVFAIVEPEFEFVRVAPPKQKRATTRRKT